MSKQSTKNNSIKHTSEIIDKAVEILAELFVAQLDEEKNREIER